VNYLTQDLYFYENAEKNGSNWTTLSLLRGVSEGEVKQFAIHKKEPLRGELEAFIACVHGNRAQQVNGKDAQAALRLTMGLLESATTGQVKNLELVS
jgi:UDP-N-acetylglucosamine 3-dehydrogenase